MLPLVTTAAAVALLLLALYFLFCAHLVRKFMARRPYDPEQFVRGLKGTPMEPYGEIILRERDWFPQQDREDVFIKSYDNLSLHGQYLTQKNARGTMLLVHGFRSSGEGDFSCILKTYYEMGFNLLVIDQRASLQSQGEYLTMGVRERWDVRSWCIWLLEWMGEKHPVVLDGISMGGATVLMAAGLDLPRNVKGVIADCPFTSPRDIFESVMERMKLPRWLLWGADICCRLMAGFSIDGARTTDALRQSDLPLLIAHGEADDFVPCRMSVESFNAAVTDDKQLILVPGAGHGMSYLVDHPRMQAALDTFLDRLCPKNAQ